MTILPSLTAGHDTTAAEWSTITTQVTRSIPIKGAKVTNTGNPIATTSGTTELDLAKLQMTGLTLVTGRYYMARYQVTWVKTVGTDAFDFKLRVNTAVSGTQIGGPSGVNLTQSFTVGQNEIAVLFKGDASYTSLFLSVVRTAGTGTLSYVGEITGFTRAWAMLEDKGDSDNWSDVA